MRLNHLNLCVPDVCAAAAFFTDYFGFSIVEEKGDGALCVLRDASGFVLTLSTLAQLAWYGYPRGFHVGFYLESRAEVDLLYQRLRDGGFEMEHPPRGLRGGWTFYCRAFDTFVVEVTC